MEMHKRNESDYLKRVQYYSAHSYVQQLTQGIKHKDLLPVIVISLIKTKMLETKTNIYLIFPFI
ncbi:Rpn family recombination-promoting nuclease/putative transposase [Rickettsia rickettsii]|uniref:Rpn family recombination-promoting nuclease/putative transposase n=1 Tax=Rickettsia rickettsii TaxID=783 RepID=UPI001E3730A6|nr:Rpn family recombination-promoting nuclease/putative transposase [Rickettsia rickettsii]USD87375.1 Rpn family recombination-promoting nuclease/putative transposase [Rickettsia rickettsii]USD88691.1 Rpn family recombination-promoting nuclease/putative transposase [Rickettsia rickettsii]